MKSLQHSELSIQVSKGLKIPYYTFVAMLDANRNELDAPIKSVTTSFDASGTEPVMKATVEAIKIAALVIFATGLSFRNPMIVENNNS